MARDEARAADAGIADPDHRPAAIGLVVSARPHAAFAPLPHIRVLAVDHDGPLVVVLTVMLAARVFVAGVLAVVIVALAVLAVFVIAGVLAVFGMILPAFVLVAGVLAIVGTAAVLVLQIVSETRTVAVLAVLLVVIQLPCRRQADRDPCPSDSRRISCRHPLWAGLTLVAFRLAALLLDFGKLVDLLLVLTTRPVGLLLLLAALLLLRCSWLAWGRPASRIRRPSSRAGEDTPGRGRRLRRRLRHRRHRLCSYSCCRRRRWR